MRKPDVRYRDDQLKLLLTFINGKADISPPVLFIEGARGTGKTYTLEKYFEANSELLSCFIQIRSMISWKPLCMYIGSKVQKLLQDRFPAVKFGSDDLVDTSNVSLLCSYLQKLFTQLDHLQSDVNLFLVLDGFNDLNEIDLELLPKFLSIHQVLPPTIKIKLRLIVSMNQSSFLAKYSTYSIPTVVFERYRNSELEEILKMAPGFWEDTLIQNKLESLGQHSVAELSKELFCHFVHFIHEAFSNYSGNNPVVLLEIMDYKWTDFVDSLTANNIKSTIQLYKSNFELFTKTSDSFSGQYRPLEGVMESSTNTSSSGTYELSLMAKFLLIAAYLASYLNNRYDAKVFSKKSHLRGGRSSYGRRNKMAHNPRHLQPSFFPLERMLAIFQSIYPVEISKEICPDFNQRDVHMRANVEVYQNVMELKSLNLITITVSNPVNYLYERLKWRVNVPWEIIVEISNNVNFDIAEYFSDIEE